MFVTNRILTGSTVSLSTWKLYIFGGDIANDEWFPISQTLSGPQNYPWSGYHLYAVSRVLVMKIEF